MTPHKQQQAVQHCTLCPRRCGADRRITVGLCGGGAVPRVARCAPHHWEEPCISGTRGSGTVFFTGCALGCIFCQNHTISRAECAATAGREMDTAALAEAFLTLQAQGVHNLNLVTASHWRPWISEALHRAREHGLALPVVWNSGGYETAEAMVQLATDVDIWLLDMKFYSPQLSDDLANAPNYFEYAAATALQACSLAGSPVYDGERLMQRGVILRLLILPGQRQDAKALLDWMAESLPPGGFVLSLMNQYTPPEHVALPGALGRRLASYEYNDVLEHAHALGLDTGYTQQRTSASAAYIPPFEV